MIQVIILPVFYTNLNFESFPNLNIYIIQMLQITFNFPYIISIVKFVDVVSYINVNFFYYINT